MHSRLGEEDYYNNKNNLFDFSYDWTRLTIASKKKDKAWQKETTQQARTSCCYFDLVFFPFSEAASTWFCILLRKINVYFTIMT